MAIEKKSLFTRTKFFWAIVLLIVFVIFAAVARLSLLLKFAYPALAFMVGAVFYFRDPPLYVAYTWWIWFLNPLVRRVVDYQVGWDPLNPVTLTPYLVTMLTFLTFFRWFQRLFSSAGFPLGIILTGIGYGYFIGIVKNGALSASYDLLMWMAPVLFAIHLMYFWRQYPQFRDIITRTFVWGIMVMGLYGIFQFFAPPVWDRYWVQNAPMGSIGFAEPFLLRIFSTLNSPGPFANVMLAGLLLIFSGKGLIRIFAAIPGYTSFFLSLVRAAWGGWLAGIIFMAVNATGRLRMRLIALSLIMGLLIFPLLSFGPIAERINERFRTFGFLRWDASLSRRVEFHSEYMGRAFGNILGEGFGSTGVATKLSGKVGELGRFGDFDSGVMHIPFVLGWPGTFLYLGGLILLLFYAFSVKNRKKESFEIVSKAIILAVLIQIIFFLPFKGVVGMIFWTFLGIAISAREYNAVDHAKLE
ncbi:glucose-6-phosphate isomerase [Candidatus Omnitrophota bacterium]